MDIHLVLLQDADEILDVNSAWLSEDAAVDRAIALNESAHADDGRADAFDFFGDYQIHTLKLEDHPSGCLSGGAAPGAAGGFARRVTSLTPGTRSREPARTWRRTVPVRAGSPEQVQQV